MGGGYLSCNPEKIEFGGNRVFIRKPVAQRLTEWQVFTLVITFFKHTIT